ncbi:MAG TPA: transglycosylase domain-containing protein, partial [Patescibacteria group bacterium]|nr:transglycosylase domain-containing protein [Patescibacteria group bacterium]
MNERLEKIKKRAKRIFWRKKNLPLALFSIFALFSVYFFVLKDLPSPSRLGSSDLAQSTRIFDRNDKLLFTIYRNRDLTFVPLSEIPKQMQQATISVEDKNFYYHGAIDLRGITRALIAILFHKRIEGGSTLTQQLVKNSLLTPERTLPRKVKEVILAYATEAVYSKNQILEMYLNQTPYGGTAWGVEAAAKTYFGKSAKDLDLAESALIAGLPEAPTTNSPFGAHPELAKQRQEQVLSDMYSEGYITAKQRDDAKKEQLKYQKFANEIKAPHFVLYVKDLLIKKYGEKMVYEGGLNVKTTLDLDIQNYAQASVAAEVAKASYAHITNGAAMVVKPGTGEILAMVGSKDYFDPNIDGNVNVTIANRQPGSSIKPVNYVTGLMKGYTAATPFVDNKICFPNQGGQEYCPVNYDGKFHGVLSMRYALGNSVNIPAVKMLKLNGIPAMIETANKLGITSFQNPDNYGLSLTLGGGETTMMEMVQAYSVFANEGYKVDLTPILKVTTSNGKVLEEYKPPQSPIFGKKVLPQDVSYIMSDILADNGARVMEFGENSELRIPGKIVSAKTGTTNDFRDNWTFGYTPSYVVGVWVGNNDNSPMYSVA